MSTIKADNISPVGSILSLTAPVAGLSVASGLTVGGVAYFSSGATFANTTDHTGVARFATGVTFAGTTDHTGVARFATGVTFAGTTDYTGLARFAAGVTMSSRLDVNGTLNVGNFDNPTNVMVKLNNTATAANTPAVGCAIPLLAYCESASGDNTTPLPPGTWFVYLVATENGSSTDEDPCAVMAKVWTVAPNTFLRFAPTNVAPTTSADIGIKYSTDNNTGVAQEGTFTTMTGANDAYFTPTSNRARFGLSTVLSGPGNHRGIVATNSNSLVNIIQGFAIRIA